MAGETYNPGDPITAANLDSWKQSNPVVGNGVKLNDFIADTNAAIVVEIATENDGGAVHVPDEPDFTQPTGSV